MSSVSVKAGIAKSKKTGGRPSLLSTDREFVQQVNLYTKSNTKNIATRLNSNYNKVCKVINNLRVSDTMKSMMDELEAFLFKPFKVTTLGVY